jgi:hypothetical protein
LSSGRLDRCVSALLQVPLQLLTPACSLDFCASHSITVHHLGVLYSTNAWDPITEDIVLQALHLLVQPSTYPVLVMCNMGRHRTGTVIGCLRKLQRWCLSAILEEYRRYTGQKVRVMDEQVSRAAKTRMSGVHLTMRRPQFLELWDIDLVSIPRGV